MILVYELKSICKNNAGIYELGHPHFKICNLLKLSYEFKGTSAKSKYKVNFKFDCNGIYVIYLLTHKIL